MADTDVHSDHMDDGCDRDQRYGSAGNGSGGADTIFISNLPDSVTEEDIATLFSEAGAIKVEHKSELRMVKLFRDQGTGFQEAEVVSDSPRSASEIVSRFNGYEYQGSKMQISLGHAPIHGSSPEFRDKRSSSLDGDCDSCGNPEFALRTHCNNCNKPRRDRVTLEERNGVVTKRITHVILDLDGTLLDTEKLVEEASKVVVANYGKVWDGRGASKRFGKRPLEAAAVLIEDYELPCKPEEVYAQTTEFLKNSWSRAKVLPGAVRLIKYLQSHAIPVAVASSSPVASIKRKLSYQKGWTEVLSIFVSGDEVEKGKPSPEIFLEAAKRLKAEPSNCLVIEDAPVGVKAAKAAGMEVVAVPSLPTKSARPLYSSADHIFSSLLDLRPEIWGLPPFQDWIEDTLPIDPWHIGGTVIKGYGRGSKVLGIPTANLPTTSFAGQLADHVCGIYLGWAALASRGIYKMVMSVGWNPYFDNSEKTAEPWLLHEFPEDFYGEELRLIVVGYIRPEANFPSLEALIERIHEDGRIAKRALEVEPYSKFQNDSYLTTIAESQVANKL